METITNLIFKKEDPIKIETVITQTEYFNEHFCLTYIHIHNDNDKFIHIKDVNKKYGNISLKIEDAKKMKFLLSTFIEKHL